MAATASVLIRGEVSSPNSSKVIGPITITSVAANEVVFALALANGDNVITIPSLPAPKGCVISLPSDNDQVVTLKGVGGDTGIAIGKTGTVVLAFDPLALPASFILNSAAAQVGKITEISFF